MLNLREVYRPESIEEALALLGRPGAVALAGGTELVSGRRRDVRAVVDLGALGLSYIRDESGAVAIGATTTLADVAESPMLRAAANGVVAQGAQRSAASLLRNQVTVGGTLIVEPAGILATVLAAMEARVEISPSTSIRGGLAGIRLLEFWHQREQLLNGTIVTQVVIPASSLSRRAAIETVARTPRDKPIVVVCVAMEVGNGVATSVAIALGGVGDAVVRADGAERMILSVRLSDSLIENVAREAMKGVTPTSDFRGSAEYRKEMVRVLTARALREIPSLR
jgi:CO/xanthine dehydrogenase FAD-binding subunit